ncbi:MAG: isoprenylcysteine carboxylmethyltransferase family protein [Moorea sp. SIO3C2]|nr:isoprenylcysteine carboxylmethyltransferase family protein [Moorena sp. SIO3C2]
MTQFKSENPVNSDYKKNIFLRITFLIYGILCYLLFLVTILYAIGFTSNFLVPKSMDTGGSTSFIQAIIIDTLLLGVFGVQHSGMARQGFKKVWTKIIPKVVERSTYVLCSCLALALLFWQWQPLGFILWNLSGTVFETILWCLSGLGWLIIFISTFMINHFELFGLQQVFLNLMGQESQTPEFKVAGFYKYVRHPLYFGFVIAFWSTPVMTLTHFFFASGILGYILVGIFLEEKDLIALYGDKYRDYKQKVSMLIPKFSKQ